MAFCDARQPRPARPMRIRMSVLDFGSRHTQLSMVIMACAVLAGMSCLHWLPTVAAIADDAGVCPGGERWAGGGWGA